jgi:hypothetical protein
MNKWIEIFGGLILLIATICLVFLGNSWGQATLNLLKGGIVWIMLLAGIILIVLGINDLKE